MFVIKNETRRGDNASTMKLVSSKTHAVFGNIEEAREFLQWMHNRTKIFENNKDTFLSKICNDVFSLCFYNKEDKTWRITDFEISKEDFEMYE